MNHVILNQVFTLFLLMGVGVAARKTGCLSPAAVTGLAGLLMQYSLPMLVFASFLRPFNPALLASAGRMLGYSLIVNVVLVGVAVLLFRGAAPDRRAILQFCTAFSNCGFLGIPLLAVVFPDSGVFHAAVFGIAFYLCAFTFGVRMFSPGGNRSALLKLALNPVILATFAGLVGFGLSLRLPGPVLACLDLGGGMASPMAMLILGAMLAEVQPRHLLGGAAEYGCAAARLVLAPLLTLALCRLLHAGPVLTRMLVILEALPAATTVAAFTETYGGDPAFVARTTFLSTALSLLTIPPIIRILERFAG